MIQDIDIFDPLIEWLMHSSVDVCVCVCVCVRARRARLGTVCVCVCFLVLPSTYITTRNITSQQDRYKKKKLSTPPRRPQKTL